MHRRNMKYAVSLCFGIALLVGCSDEEPNGKLSDFAQEFINIRMGGQNSRAMTGQNIINQSFQGLMGGMTGIPGGRTKNVSDSTLFEPWTSCAEITEVTNEDGSTTVTYDYGDGCDEGWGEYSYTMFGLFQYTYLNTSNVSGSVMRYGYSYSSLYENYGGQYGDNDSSRWVTNGTSSYEGESSYDTVSMKFSGWFEHEDNSEYAYGDTEYDYNSSGRSTYNESGYRVERSEYEYNTADSYYKTKVISPLVTNYRCDTQEDGGLPVSRAIFVWVPVSGIERVTYKQEGKEGMFEINYGDGECDNIIFVTENGVTTRVDLGELLVRLF
jgi:hypothetical protein